MFLFPGRGALAALAISLLSVLGAGSALAGGYPAPGYGDFRGAPPFMAGPCGMSRRYPPAPWYHGGPPGRGWPAHRMPATAPGPQPTAGGEPDSEGDPAAAGDNASVGIAHMRFEQPVVTIKKGGMVTWSNGDSMPHTVVASDGSFGSSRLVAGDSFSHTFPESGTYEYYCSLHPMMRGRVVVVD